MMFDFLKKRRALGLVAVLAGVGVAAALLWQLDPGAANARSDDDGEDATPVVKTQDDHLRDIAAAVPDFGGLYFDQSNPDVLKVFMLDTDDAAKKGRVRSAIEEAFPDSVPSAGIEVVQGQYGMTQLGGWYDDLRTRLASSALMPDGLAMTDLEEDRNRIEVGVTDESLVSKVNEVVSAAGIPSGAVRVTVRPRVQHTGLRSAAGLDQSLGEASPSVSQTTQTVQSRIRPVVGGLQLTTHDNGVCTLGFNASRGGVKGVVTNSHCTSIFAAEDNTVVHQATKDDDDNRIGKETVDGDLFDCSGRKWAGYQCRLADASFIKYDSGVSNDLGKIARTTGSRSITISKSNPRFRVVSEGSGHVGQIVVMVGRSTGMYATAIQETCADVTLSPPSGGTVVMLCQDFAAITTLPRGDSGAPIFKITNSPRYGDVRLYGVVWGEDTHPSYPSMVYSPIAQIQAYNELGSLRTCAAPYTC